MSNEAPPAPLARQARSRATQDRISEAGMRLLQDNGPEAVTVAAVAAEAGVSVGSVYRRFGDKERLLAEIQAQFTQDFRADLRERLSEHRLGSSTPPAEVVAVAVTGLAGTFRAHAGLLRVFMLLGTQNQAVLDEGSTASIEGGRAFRDTIMLAASALRHHEDVEAAIDFAYRLIYAACAHRVIHGEHLESPRALSWDELVEQLRIAVTAYLLAKPGGSGEVPTF